MKKTRIKINTIKSQNKAHLNLLSEVVAPDTLFSRVPRLEEVAKARVEHKNKFNTIRELGQVTTERMHYVAQIDQSVWSAILEVFAKYHPVSGELMDDGLLYKFDQEKGCLVLNKDFFYTILEVLEQAGDQCDMRGKNKIMV